MDLDQILEQMTFEEKARILSGVGMGTYPVERLGVPSLRFADGPHGVRCEREKNRTHFPSLCAIGSSFSRETARRMGEALADECIDEGVGCLLGPGINVKRHILCGRNFEYMSEDPVISGYLAAEYIKGLEENGVATSLKHFALNNQERDRIELSVEIDERTMREIYLRGFEIAVKEGKPSTVMTSYNKINAVWASENPHLLTDILSDEWGYEGVVLSDWGAVHDIVRSISAGLHLQMPQNSAIVDKLREGVESGRITMEKIDAAVLKVLIFVYKNTPKHCNYDRDKQHKIAREIAADCIVLLKNCGDVLPISEEKYKKIAVVGEYAVKPLISGQGSAEVLQSEEYTDSPLSELEKRFPSVEFKYLQQYTSDSFSHEMLWPKSAKFKQDIEDCDLVIFFAGSMVSEDTENFDRRSAELNGNFEMFMKNAKQAGKRCVLVLQNGGAMILGPSAMACDAIVEAWLGGEAAGGAISDVLSGDVNPSGKLQETMPRAMRRDLEYPGNGLFVEYKERFDVGYRYYDKHSEEILYPFGHGLSYTSFEYSDAVVDAEAMTLSFTVTNTGERFGAEAWQLYVSDPVATVLRPIKELRRFDKVRLAPGESTRVTVELCERDFAYFNTSLGDWVAENGRYELLVGSSSRDIRLTAEIMISEDMPYSIQALGEAMIG